MRLNSSRFMSTQRINGSRKILSIGALIVIGAYSLRDGVQAQLLGSNLSTKQCDRDASGAALISNSQYSKNKSEFEFKI